MEQDPLFYPLFVFIYIRRQQVFSLFSFITVHLNCIKTTRYAMSSKLNCLEDDEKNPHRFKIK